MIDLVELKQLINNETFKIELLVNNVILKDTQTDECIILCELGVKKND